MKQNPSVSAGSRRNFLRSAGLVALAAPAAAQALPERPFIPPGQWWHGRNRLSLLAEGIVLGMPQFSPPELDPPLGPIPWVLPPMDTNPTTPAIEPPALPPGMAPRLRVTFPVRQTKDILAVQLYVFPYNLPVPFPTPPPPVLEDPAAPNPTISYLEIKVNWVEFGRGHSIAFVGDVVLNNPVSPFGSLVGLAGMVTAGFECNAEGTQFNLLATHCAGSHTTMAAQAFGHLKIR